MTRWSLFVLLAEMRTGSNFLEANLAALPGVRMHGEAFNPRFVGAPDRADLLGWTLARREADPAGLLDRLRAEPGLNGFRLFGDHDARAEALVLADPATAKVVLTRNPAESYVSRKIAAETGQWRLTGAGRTPSAPVRFDAAEFAAHLDHLQVVQARIRRALQTSGQTAFWIDYEELQDLDVVNGLAAFLGVPARLPALDRTLKKQNPEPLAERVANFDEMAAALGALDPFTLAQAPAYEPRRGPAVPQAVAAPRSPLLFLPIPSGPGEAVRAWLSALDGGSPAVEGFVHKSLRQWKAARPGHLSFTVLRHPLARAHAAFCERILARGPGSFPELRETLRRAFALPMPEEGLAADVPWGASDHRAAFARFLQILKANLGGQTSFRVDPAWASQLAVVQGFAGLVPPDLVLREERLAEDLGALALRVGRPAPPLPASTDPFAARLRVIHDPGLEALARDAYRRDYVAWGFGDWVPV